MLLHAHVLFEASCHHTAMFGHKYFSMTPKVQHFYDNLVINIIIDCYGTKHILLAYLDKIAILTAVETR